MEEARLPYWVFDPAPFQFPKPRVPLLPGISPNSFGKLRGKEFKVVGGDAPRTAFRRGRYALWAAFKAAGITSGSAVLVPSYHCRTMLDPAISLGASVVLYHLRPDLQPDMAALERAVAASPVPVRAMLATHYFGFARALGDAADFCRRRGICFIEDCSHALLTDALQPRIGELGKFLITSPYKFLPCEEGGWLIDRSQSPKVLRNRVKPKPRAELSLLWAAWEHAAKSSAGDLSHSLIDKRPPVASAVIDYWQIEEQSGPSPLYDASEEAVGPTAVSQVIAALCSLDKIATIRRDNYLRWVSAMDSVPRARPLWPDLPAGTVPYMFPLLIDRPEADFPRLKQLGVPIWRWDELAVSSCGIARDYRLRLLHLPCHQALSAPQLDWMMAALKRVLYS